MYITMMPSKKEIDEFFQLLDILTYIFYQRELDLLNQGYDEEELYYGDNCFCPDAELPICENTFLELVGAPLSKGEKLSLCFLRKNPKTYQSLLIPFILSNSVFPALESYYLEYDRKKRLFSINPSTNSNFYLGTKEEAIMSTKAIFCNKDKCRFFTKIIIHNIKKRFPNYLSQISDFVLEHY